MYQTSQSKSMLKYHGLKILGYNFKCQQNIYGFCDVVQLCDKVSFNYSINY